jgi:probable rRNA maturation factor
LKSNLIINKKLINLTFYFDSRSVKPRELREYKQWLERFSNGLSSFFSNGELKQIIKRKKVNQLNFSITLCGDAKIKKLNSQYRDKNKITDVLSFPLNESLRNVDEFDIFLGKIELGDIFICKSKCIKQAKEFNLNFFEEFLHLAVHGFLHLCGYDHEISLKEEKHMEKLEETIIKACL